MSSINARFFKYKKNRKVIQFKDITKIPQITKTRVAIIIPYRNREEHLYKFIEHFNNLDDSVLKGSILDIYIIEQNNEDKFNIGLLLNIGYLLSSEKVKYDRYIFHDVDLFPDQSIFELYFASPKKQIHYIIPKVEHKYNFEMYLGGVIGLSGRCFEKINGFPNNFFGWGGEDDALYNRIAANNISVYRPSIGGYELAFHEKPEKNGMNTIKQENVLNDLLNWRKNGVSQLKGFEFISVVEDSAALFPFPKSTNPNIKYLFYKINYLGKSADVDYRIVEEINHLKVPSKVDKLLKINRSRCSKGTRKSRITRNCTAKRK